MTVDAPEALIRAIKAGQRPLIVCGAGVSTYVTGGQAPSWHSLIKSGITKVRSLDKGTSAWEAYSLELLETGNTDDWLDVADKVTELLGSANSSAFFDWIYDCVGSLEVKNSDLLEGLFSLQCPIATTNYDSLLTSYSGKPPIDSANAASIARVIKGEVEGIVHLHGMATLPQSIVLGRRSYESLAKDQDQNYVKVASYLNRPTVFVGCSYAGITDADFSNIGFLLEGLKAAREPQFWLCRASDVPVIGGDTSIHPVVYGERYEDLAPFLANLSSFTPSSSGKATRREFVSIEQLEPKPKLFGRDTELNEISTSLSHGGHAVLSGPPGIGKTALAVSALYDQNVINLFGQNRLFISLENLYDHQFFATELVKALGLVVNTNALVNTRQIQSLCRETKVCVLFDNAEGLFDNDFMAAEKSLALLGQIENLSIVVTMRGLVPQLDNAVSISSLPALNYEASLAAFEALAGGSAIRDKSGIDALMNALDGHALSINIMAAHSRNAASITQLVDSWNTQRAYFLKRMGQAESRLTSVRASLAITLGSRAIKSDPLARRLLSAISVLPDGITPSTAARVLSGSSAVSRSRASNALLALANARLVQPKPDERQRMLTPLREAVQLDLSISTSTVKSIVKLYAKDLIRSTQMSTDEVVYKSIDSEPLNHEAACKLALEHLGPTDNCHDMIRGYISYITASGRPISTFFEEACKEFAEKQMYFEAADILDRVAYCHFLRGAVDKAKDLYLKAIPYTRQCAKTQPRGRVLHGLGLCARTLGDHAEATTYFDKAIDAVSFYPRPDNFCLGNCSLSLAQSAWSRGDEGAVADNLDKAEHFYKEAGDQLGLANVAIYRAKIERSEALSLIESSLNFLANKRLTASHSMALLALGDYWYQRGEAQKAYNAYDEALASAEAGANASNEAHARIRRGQAALVLGLHNSGLSDIHNGFDLWFATAVSHGSSKEGFLHMRDALTAASTASSLTSYGRARDAWQRSESLDLIREWVNFEFGKYSESDLSLGN